MNCVESEVLRSVQLDDENNAMIILDQSKLPNEKLFIRLTSQNAIWEAIFELKVRGAPAIGIAAGYGVYLGAKESTATNFEDFYADFKKCSEYLATARPTAVNLVWALNRMEAKLIEVKDKTVEEIKLALRDEAELIKEEDEQVCKSIGEYALSLLEDNMGLLTHCNAGAIATARYGTALAPMYLGHERGMKFKVYADETRPLHQGSRLTAWELNEAGIDVTLICDSMASIVMKEGKIDAVLVGCDRVAANGDTANKIGTSGVAIMAKHYNIPFYVCAPMSTIDMDTKTGDDIHIELRPESEVTTKWYEKPMAPEGVAVYNPCFDVTDKELITAIVTEKGIAYPPFEESLAKIFA